MRDQICICMHILFKGSTFVQIPTLSNFQGQDLNLAANQDDIEVWIGSQPCNVTSLSANQIVCTPPKQQPEPTDRHGRPSGALPLVQV